MLRDRCAGSGANRTLEQRVHRDRLAEPDCRLHLIAARAIVAEHAVGGAGGSLRPFQPHLLANRAPAGVDRFAPAQQRGRHPPGLDLRGQVIEEHLRAVPARRRGERPRGLDAEPGRDHAPGIGVAPRDDLHDRHRVDPGEHGARRGGVGIGAAGGLEDQLHRLACSGEIGRAAADLAGADDDGGRGIEPSLRSRRHTGSWGRPRARSPMMLRCTSAVPPPMVSAGANRKP
jgi:hypothetical protein